MSVHATLRRQPSQRNPLAHAAPRPARQLERVSPPRLEATRHGLRGAGTSSLSTRLRDVVVLVATSLSLGVGVGCGGHTPGSQQAHPPTPCVHGQCAEGYSCHYEHARDGGTAQLSICRPESGRCNASIDCLPSQVCVRHTERLGVCNRRQF